VIVITGPTACGKTKIAATLACEISGEVVYADSMCVYKKMDIGTAKPAAEARMGVTHHMIDVVYPDETFSAGLYRQMSDPIINNIESRGKIPVLSGGTGFYINAAVYGTEFTSHDDRGIRENLIEFAEREGSERLHALLREADPETAKTLSHKNVRRVARALAFYKSTGQTIFSHNLTESKKPPQKNVFFFILAAERDELYKRINKRVDIMMECGLLEEVKGLLAEGYHGGLVSMQGIGYKELVRHLAGDCSLGDAIEQIKQNTRRYAKRQLTWFKNRPNPGAIIIDSENDPITQIKKIISG